MAEMESDRKVIVLSLGAGVLLTLMALFGQLFPQREILSALWCVQLLFLTGANAVGLHMFWRRSAAFTIGLVFLTILSGVYCVLPITARDALIYHLYVPKLWLEAGRIVEISWFDLSYFPLLLSLGYGGFLGSGLESFVAFYHLLFLVPCAAVTYLLSGRFFGRLDWLAPALLITTPVIFRLSNEPMADLAPLLFSGIHLLLIHQVLRGESRRWGALGAGLALGLALASKYTALLGAGLYGIALLFIAPTAIFSVAVGALLPLAPWLVRNFIWTSNPLYPLLGSGPQAYVGELGAIGYRMAAYGEGIGSAVLIPLRMAFFGMDGEIRTFDGVATPLLILGIVSASKLNRVGRIYGAVAVAHLVIAPLLFHSLIRYHAVIGILLFIFAAQGIRLLSERFGRPVLLGALIFQSIWFGLYLGEYETNREARKFFESDDNSEVYLRRQLSEYVLSKKLTELLPESSVTYLVLTGNRYYYYDRVVRSTYFSGEGVSEWVRSGLRPEAFREVTHLAAHERRLGELLKGEFQADKLSEERWLRIVREDLSLVWRGDGYIVFRLRAAD